MVELGTIIQEGEHDPGVDARTAMELYKLRLVEWWYSYGTSTPMFNRYIKLIKYSALIFC